MQYSVVSLFFVLCVLLCARDAAGCKNVAACVGGYALGLDTSRCRGASSSSADAVRSTAIRFATGEQAFRLQRAYVRSANVLDFATVRITCDSGYDQSWTQLRALSDSYILMDNLNLVLEANITCRFEIACSLSKCIPLGGNFAGASGGAFSLTNVGYSENLLGDDNTPYVMLVGEGCYVPHCVTYTTTPSGDSVCGACAQGYTPSEDGSQCTEIPTWVTTATPTTPTPTTPTPTTPTPTTPTPTTPTPTTPTPTTPTPTTPTPTTPTPTTTPSTTTTPTTTSTPPTTTPAPTASPVPTTATPTTPTATPTTPSAAPTTTTTTTTTRAPTASPTTTTTTTTPTTTTPPPTGCPATSTTSNSSDVGCVCQRGYKYDNTTNECRGTYYKLRNDQGAQLLTGKGLGASVEVNAEKSVDFDDQLWLLIDGYVMNKKSGRVLDIENYDPKPSVRVLTWTQKKAPTAFQNQQFEFTAARHIMSSIDNRYVLDVQYGGGGKVALWEAKSGPDAANQRFTVEKFEV